MSLDVEFDDTVLQNLIQHFGDDADDWLNGVAQEMNGEIVESFGSGPPGKRHERDGVTHLASTPGFPPNVDLGNLRASMHVTRKGNLRYEISDGVEYGLKLEEGLDGIEPRPFVNPVFARWRKKIIRKARSLIK